MQSRMDKYSAENSSYRSRTQKNKDLYESVRNSNLSAFDVNSNVSVIDDNAKTVSISHVNELLDDIYKDSTPRRKSIDISEIPTTEIVKEDIIDTREYDINAILEKARMGKNVDYNRERLKKVRDAEKDILTNLDITKRINEENEYKAKRKQEEQELTDLINTITQIEKINKDKYDKDSSESLDLLSDLSDDNVDVDDDKITAQSDNKDVLDEETIKQRIMQELIEKEPEKKEEIEKKLESSEEKIEKTLSKLNIDMDKYEDFSDVSKKDTVSFIIKIIIFIIILALIVGAVFILNNILGLGLFG
jgi:hypothetical protein